MSTDHLPQPGLERHLLLVEPEERLRALLRSWLARRGCFVTAARDADHAERLLEGLAFDLILAEAGAASRLVKGGRAPVLALASGAQEASGATEAGAVKVLTRPFEPEELWAAIEEQVPREPSAEGADAPLRLGPITFDRITRELRREGEIMRLTAAEARLMERLAGRPGEPVSRAQLVDRPEEGETAAQLRAVDVQITRLRRKLEPDPRNPRYILTVRGTGYMLAPDS